jgi:hypothetical protein
MIHLLLGAPALALLLMRQIPVFNPVKRMVNTPLCVLFGLFVASCILHASPLAPLVDEYVKTQFPTMAAVGNKISLESATQALAYMQGQKTALTEYKDDLASAGLTDPNAHAKFVQHEEDLATTNGIVSPAEPK